MWVSLNKRLVNTLYPNFFPVNMIFLEEQSSGYNKICMGFNPRGGARGPLSAPRLHVTHRCSVSNGYYKLALICLELRALKNTAPSRVDRVGDVTPQSEVVKSDLDSLSAVTLKRVLTDDVRRIAVWVVG